MDPITRLFVFTGAFAAVVVITSVIYRRITGKSFITFDSGRPKGAEGSQSSSPLNKQMSPLFGGALAGLVVSTYILFKSHDILRALLVGGAVFAVIYWVMWAGQHLGASDEEKARPSGCGRLICVSYRSAISWS